MNSNLYGKAVGLLEDYVKSVEAQAIFAYNSYRNSSENEHNNDAYRIARQESFLTSGGYPGEFGPISKKLGLDMKELSALFQLGLTKGKLKKAYLVTFSKYTRHKHKVSISQYALVGSTEKCVIVWGPDISSYDGTLRNRNFPYATLKIVPDVHQWFPSLPKAQAFARSILQPLIDPLLVNLDSIDQGVFTKVDPVNPKWD